MKSQRLTVMAFVCAEQHYPGSLKQIEHDAVAF
jgi:hypothetical protein